MNFVIALLTAMSLEFWLRMYVDDEACPACFEPYEHCPKKSILIVLYAVDCLLLHIVNAMLLTMLLNLKLSNIFFFMLWPVIVVYAVGHCCCDKVMNAVVSQIIEPCCLDPVM